MDKEHLRRIQEEHRRNYDDAPAFSADDEAPVIPRRGPDPEPHVFVPDAEEGDDFETEDAEAEDFFSEDETEDE